MAFNSDTYHANKLRRSAYANLERARDIKARVADGTAYEWEAPRVSMYAHCARGDMHLSLMYRSLAKMAKSRKGL